MNPSQWILDLEKAISKDVEDAQKRALTNTINAGKTLAWYLAFIVIFIILGYIVLGGNTIEIQKD